MMTLRAVRRVPREQWPTRRVRDHMVPLGDQEDGEVIGIITLSDLTCWRRRWRTLEGSTH
jgi:hypothetical protein